MNFKVVIVLTALACLPAWPAAGQVVIKKNAGDKSGLDVSGLAASGGAGATFKQTLESDLFRSGWFVRAPAGAAEYEVKGSASGGLSVQCTATDRTGGQRYGKSYSVSEAEARKLAHRVADEIILALTGKKGLNSGRIAAISNRSGRKEVYVLDCDGQNPRQLTHDKSISIGPYWGPEGRLLSYTSYLKGFPDAYVIDVTSGSRRRVASYPGSNQAGGISPDGRSIAMVLSRTGNMELYVAGIDGSSPTRLTRTPKSEASPCWSPDGRQIAYVSDQSGTPQIYVVDRAGGAPTRLTSRGSQNVAPDWGANGWIAYSSSVGGRFQIHVVHPATRETKEVTKDGADYEDPTWAPDGRHILCARSRGYKSELWVVDTLGDPPFTLTNLPGDWYSPTWSR